MLTISPIYKSTFIAQPPNTQSIWVGVAVANIRTDTNEKKTKIKDFNQPTVWVWSSIYEKSTIHCTILYHNHSISFFYINYFRCVISICILCSFKFWCNQWQCGGRTSSLSFIDLLTDAVDDVLICGNWATH